MNLELKKLMCDAIERPRPKSVEELCLPIWNQPFFYKIDKARVLTVSYNPTDRGARINYLSLLEKFKENGKLDTEVIFNVLYTFKKETTWRRNYDLIFSKLNIDSDEISHMDVSIFPYKSFKDFCALRFLDNTKQYLLKTIEILEEQLSYIFIDGKQNMETFNSLKKDYKEICKTKLPVNNSKNEFDLIISKHKTQNTYLIYYGCFLYGQTMPSKENVIAIANYIKDKTI